MIKQLINIHTFKTLCLLFLIFNNFYSNSLRADDNTQLWFLQNAGFEENLGQHTGDSTTDILFLLKNANLDINITNRGISYVFKQNRGVTNQTQSNNDQSQFTKLYRADFKINGAIISKNKLKKEQELNSRSNYYLGKTSKITNIKSYKRLVFKDVYPLIDWVVFIENGNVAYDFVVNPGGDPAMIQIEYNGITQLINQENKLTIKTPLGEIIEGDLFSYQEANNEKHEINSHYDVFNNIVGFNIGKYDKNKTLVIDPPLLWATYFGGDGNDIIHSIETDQNGNVYVVGETQSNDFPVPGAIQAVNNGNTDFFVSRFDNNGVLQWSTYYGGADEDIAYDLATDLSGNCFITGHTMSDPFPTQDPGSGAYFQNSISCFFGCQDAFIVELDVNGSLIWATYIGGVNFGSDEGRSITCDINENVYLTGFTTDDAFPMQNLPGAYNQPVYGGGFFGGDAFVMKFNNLGALQWSTFFGGDSPEEANDITTDPAGNVFIVGETYSDVPSFPITPGAFQAAHPSGSAAYAPFIAKFDNANQLAWSTFFGGTSDDLGNGIAVDDVGNSYVIGSATSADFPVVGAALQTALNGSTDPFIAKFTPAGSCVWSTYFGGSNVDVGNAIATDGAASLYLTGSTLSANFYVAGGSFTQTTNKGSEDIFISEMDTSGSLSWSTYYGGTNADIGNSITVDRNNADFYVAGQTTTTGISLNTLPLTGAYNQTVHGGGAQDGFILKFASASCVPPTITVSSNQTICNGNTVILTASGADTFSWSPSSGLSSSTGSGVVCSAVSNTSYSVTGTTGVCSSTSIVTVFVNALPTVTSSGNVTLCSGDVTMLSVLSTDACVWSPSSGISATTGTSVLLSTTTTITYTVTASNNYGCTDEVMIQVQVNSYPTVAVASDATICAGGSAGLSASGAIDYVWMDAATLSSSTGDVVLATPGTITVYTVTGSIGNGCVDNAIVAVTVDQIPVLSVSSDLSVCDGSSKTLTASGGNSYSWMPFSGLNITTGTSVLCSPIVNTTYTVVASNGICTGMANVNVYVSSLPTISTSSDYTLCFGNSVQLTASGAISYLWTPTVGLDVTTGAAVIASPGSATTYTVIGYNDNECFSQSSVSTQVISLSFLSNVTAANCDNNDGIIQVVNLLGGNPPYSYSISGNTAQDSAKFIGLISGTYSITVSDANGCSFILLDTVNAINTVDASFTATPPVGYIPQVFSFDNSTTGATNYTWFFGDGNSSSSTNATHDYASAGTYTIVLMAYDTTINCVDSAYAIVDLYVPTLDEMPNVFSPDGDGVNDVYMISPAGLRKFTANVYDRWGNKINEFELNGIYQTGWDGKTKSGIDLPAGTYYITVTGEGINGESYSLQQVVTLVR